MENDRERIHKKYGCVFTMIAVLVMSIIIASPASADTADILLDFETKIKNGKSYFTASKEIAIAYIGTAADLAMLVREMVLKAGVIAAERDENINKAEKDTIDGFLAGAAESLGINSEEYAELEQALEKSRHGRHRWRKGTDTTTSTTTTTSTVEPTSPAS